MGIDITPELLDQIDKFLKGDLSKEENEDFKKRIIEDASLKQEVNIQKQLWVSKSQDNWDLIHASEAEEELKNIKKILQQEDVLATSQTIKTIGKEYSASKGQTKTRSFYPLMGIAAAVLLLLVSVFVLTQKPDLPDYYADNVEWHNLTSFTEKGESVGDFQKGEQFFKNKEYDKAIDFFSKISKQDELYPFSLIRLGAANDLLGNNKEAMKSFVELSLLENTLESSKGYWYQALIHFKEDNKEKTMETLEIILKDTTNYRFKKAKKIYNKLN